MLGKLKNRSKSSKGSIPSPDEKKSRGEIAKTHYTASVTDELFEALEMVEDFGKTLEAVLHK